MKTNVNKLKNTIVRFITRLDETTTLQSIIASTASTGTLFFRYLYSVSQGFLVFTEATSLITSTLDLVTIHTSNLHSTGMYRLP